MPERVEQGEPREGAQGRGRNGREAIIKKPKGVTGRRVTKGPNRAAKGVKTSLLRETLGRRGKGRKPLVTGT